MVRVLRFERNRGKGGAVRLVCWCARVLKLLLGFVLIVRWLCIQGVQSTRGKYVLMVDADGATEITDLKRLEEELRSV